MSAIFILSHICFTMFHGKRLVLIIIKLRSMDMLNLVRGIVEPGYLDGHEDLSDVKVSKRVKILHKQVQNGVAEMQVFK